MDELLELLMIIGRNIFMGNKMNGKPTPMMKQYLEIKKKYSNDILFFRMGDFYEMFFEDAKVAAKILDIALTSRQNDIPMCGVPYHAAESYIARLIKAGRRVAICEQLETVPSSGSIVRREVVRVVTPGTLIESNLLQSDDNNFLGAVTIEKESIGLSFVDVSTGDLFFTSFKKELDIFRAEIAKFNPTEIILKGDEFPENKALIDFIFNKNIPIYRIDQWRYDLDYLKDLICQIFSTSNTKGLGLTNDLEIITLGATLQYLQETHKKTFSYLKNPQKINSTQEMYLDESTVASLELVRNQEDKTKNKTLLSVLDYCQTPMGRRTLERNILHPLLDRVLLEKRLDLVDFFYTQDELTAKIIGFLKKVLDVERLLSRFSMEKFFSRNFIALRDSLEAASEIKKCLEQEEGIINFWAQSIPNLKKIADQIRETIEDEPALTLEQGRIIRAGFRDDLDHLYSLKVDAKSWILDYQEEQKKQLGITTLKIKYNKILGYYLEVSKGQADKIPGNYFRKQTLVNSERFTTEKLQEFESDILSASEKIMAIEKEEIEKLCLDILKEQKIIQTIGTLMGELDFYISLVTAAKENKFVKPVLAKDDFSFIQEGRHPMVEKYFTKEVFIPNEVDFGSPDKIIKIITGPNMSGKSTYIRMVALIQLMAQIGSFVPASQASLSLVDRIFTRIGAADNISRGESTFLVEMNEAANILNNATSKSLIIMDEIGRGTSTYDGLSIAWAIVVYLQAKLKCKTLFATHYHELTDLEKESGVVNYKVLVQENPEGITFLHKVVKGAADKSYGIHVAKLAGLPLEIVKQAAIILETLENKSLGDENNFSGARDMNQQLELFDNKSQIIDFLQSLEVNKITPLEALQKLAQLKEMLD